VGAVMPEGMTGRRFLRHIALDGPRRYLDAQSIVRPYELAALFTPEASARMARYDPWQESIAHLGAAGDWMSGVQYGDLQTYLPLDVLTKVDRMTMAHSIEARPVLLDHKLVEFAATVPQQYLLRNGTTKYIFKRAMRGILPDGIINRQKHGFAVPWAHWFRGDLSGFIRDVLLSDASRQRGILDPAYLTHLLKLHEGGRNLDDHLWTLVSFELWCRANLDGPRSVAVAARPRAQQAGTIAHLTLGSSAASH
jgi:asparagine synthase (glutamine-hydrolysing)